MKRSRQQYLEPSQSSNSKKPKKQQVVVPNVNLEWYLHKETVNRQIFYNPNFPDYKVTNFINHRNGFNNFHASYMKSKTSENSKKKDYNSYLTCHYGFNLSNQNNSTNFPRFWCDDYPYDDSQTDYIKNVLTSIYNSFVYWFYYQVPQ
jgi:hypothetical protein